MPHRISVLLLAVLALAGCVKDPEGAKVAGGAAPAPLLLAAEDVHTVRNSALASGPAITGSIQPERRADLRAEVPAIVLKVLKDNGDTVRRGELLVQLDDTALRDALTSAEASARAASQAFEQVAAAIRAEQDVAQLGHDLGAGARGRRDPAQQCAERPRSGQDPRRPGPAAAPAHRGARAVRRPGERAQGVARATPRRSARNCSR